MDVVRNYENLINTKKTENYKKGLSIEHFDNFNTAMNYYHHKITAKVGQTREEKLNC